MEPLKFAYPASNWLLRIALMVLVYIIYFVTFRAFQTSQMEFWIACGFAFFAMLLFVGGFMKSSNLTVISAILLSLGAAYKIVMHFMFSEGNFVAIFGVLGAIAFYFSTSGNRKK